MKTIYIIGGIVAALALLFVYFRRQQGTAASPASTIAPPPPIPAGTQAGRPAISSRLDSGLAGGGGSGNTWTRTIATGGISRVPGGSTGQALATGGLSFVSHGLGLPWP